jgi:hypothetical protein
MGVRHSPEGGRQDTAEVRFGVQEWLEAVVTLALVLAGAAFVLGLAYWFVIPR